MARAIKVRKPPALPPVHPGEILREDVLPALGVSVSDAARRMGISRQTLHRLLSEVTGITPGMALRLGKFCGNGPEIWMRLQQAYDLWQAERELRGELAKISAG
jgi:addiction module HigA family antidote